MGRLDDLLIDRLWSPLAGRIEQRFGIGPWRLAIECLHGSIAAYVAAVALEIATKGPQDGIFVTMLRALAWLWILDRVRRLALRQGASPSGVRAARFCEGMFRLLLAAMVPVSLCFAREPDNFLYSVSLALLACHLYLKASDAPPPERRGRLAWLRA